jgi:uncharacterized lipoprotein YddW (UPF0748 family)
VIRSLLCCLAAVGISHGASVYVPATITPPNLPQEFRGAWVAAVNNIDWPSKPGLPTAQQQAELLAILDRAEALKLNVVVLQVRPACDALYKSSLEPWSEYLTGAMGKAPSPMWDPLAFAVAEAHARGLELHAWFNPFRARHNTGFSPISRDHISKTRPGLAKPYSASLWLDPGLPEVHDHSLKVILDVVKRYDVDGIHIDDYFYPYREKDAAGKLLPFPDWTSWNNYVKAGGKLERDDWRRDNVNRFVSRMYREVKQAKPWLKVGISPFGIYRPGFPEQIKGFDQYESIYADPRVWLHTGSLDYIAPQLYWRIEPPAQSFPVLLNWWTENNPKNRLIVAGLNSTAVASNQAAVNPTGRGWPVSEIPRQIEIGRQQRGSSGHIHWNMSALMKNKGGLADELSRTVYRERALVPPLPGTSGSESAAPAVNARPAGKGTRVQWSHGKASDVNFWLVQTRSGTEWRTQVLPRQNSWLEVSSAVDAATVRAIDRFGRVGPAAAVARQAPASTPARR